MIQVRFVRKAHEAMLEAIEMAREFEDINKTEFKEHNGDLYMKIPDNELELWIELLESMDGPENPIFGKLADKLAEMDSTADEEIDEYNPEPEEKRDELDAKPSPEGGAATESPSGDKKAADLPKVS